MVAFTNDKFEGDGADRNLWLQAVLLAQEPLTDDRVPPRVEITYPPDGHGEHGRHVTFGVDALVAQATDNVSLVSAELLFDGMPTEMKLDLNFRMGRFVFPLLLRTANAGEHTVAVRVTDRAGNSSLSAPRTIMIPSNALS